MVPIEYTNDQNTICKVIKGYIYTLRSYYTIYLKRHLSSLFYLHLSGK